MPHNKKDARVEGIPRLTWGGWIKTECEGATENLRKVATVIRVTMSMDSISQAACVRDHRTDRK